MREYIALDKCLDGHLYRIEARNGIFGVFKTESRAFTLARDKWGLVSLFDEFHYDIGAPFGTVFPIEDIGLSPVPVEELLPYLKKLTREVMIKRIDKQGASDEDRKRWLAPWGDE